MKNPRPTITWLSDLHGSDFPAIGNKAASLAQIIALGLPAPDGICVTSAAYLRHINVDCGDTFPQIETASLSTNERVKAFCQQARTAIMSGELSRELSQNLGMAYGKMDQRGVSRCVAVRSSSSVEDHDQSSFSGVYATFLNVCGMDALAHSTKKCWASLWTPSAVNWCIARGYDLSDYVMSVIVQPMVAADAAGVMFTANPISGSPFEVIINSNWGQGEGIVSGRTDSDIFVIEESDLSIKSAQIADKKQMVSATDIELQSVNSDKAQQPSLSDDQAKQLARMGLVLEERFGCPQDIEWAIENDTIHLLQSRAISGLPRYFPLPAGDQPKTQDSRWSVEFRDHLSPFGRSLELKKNAVYRGALSCALGYPIENHQKVINGYIYHREVHHKARYVPESLRVLWQFARWLFLSRDADSEFRERTIPVLVERMKRIELELQESDGFAKRREILTKAIEAYFDFEAASVLVGVLANTFTSLSLRSSARILNGRTLLDASILFTGLPNLTVERDRELVRLREEIKKQNRHFLFDGEYTLAEVRSCMLRNTDGCNFMRDLDRFSERFGYIWASGNVKDPGWRTSHALMFAMLGQSDRQASAAELHSDLSQDFQRDVERRLRSSWYGRLFPPALKGYGTLLALARRYYPCREDYNHYLSSAVMLIKRILEACAEDLIKIDVCHSTDGIFYLTYDEICSISECFNITDTSHYSSLIRVRMAESKREKRLGPPIVIDLSGDSPSASSSEEEPGLTGIPGCAGVTTGIVRVVNRFNLGDLRAGEVLVCDNFRPEWSPVLMYVKGLVTDRGYMLSHGANLAREAGVPAVMGTKIATRVLRDGEEIQVDGNRGIVRRERTRGSWRKSVTTNSEPSAISSLPV